MKHDIRTPADLGLIIRAVRKSSRLRQDDVAATVGVSQQFAVDVERGKPTVQLGRVLRLLDELGITLVVDLPDDASQMLAKLTAAKAAKSAAGARDAKGAKLATGT